MAESNFQTLLDGVDTDTSTVLDVCKNYNNLESPPPITDQQFNEHPFFTKYFSKQLGEILQFWITDGSLDENQKEIFHDCSAFILKLTKTHSNIKPWLNKQTELINLTEKLLDEIASYGYYIGIGGTEDTSLDEFDWLVQAFENVSCQQLLNILVKTVTSRFYIDGLYRLSDVDALFLTVTQHFLLVTCPDYILTCANDKSYCLQIVNKMLGHYSEIYATFLPFIKQWTNAVILCLLYPIKFVLASIRSISSEQKKIIYGLILTILLNKSTVDPNIEQARISLIYTSLCLLIEIIRSDKDLSNQLKNKTDEKSDLIKILNDLSKNEVNNTIQLKALELHSLLVPEKEFLTENNTEQVTGVFVKNINEAIQDGTPEQIDEILGGLKDLVQNDEVKKEFMKQNGLPSIIKFAKETKDDPLPLEITYAMTFNGDAKKVINQDKEFVDHIKELRESEKKDVSKMAHGIMWKLEDEEKFKKKEEEKEKEKESDQESKPKENSDNKDGKKYDVMISYCWAQKPLCHQISDRLEADKYKVWLDRDEMHGSIIERMAEAIEQAKVVLICMSSNYKNSINCKAEAEYAFNRKSNIVPLVVEPQYKADGWLGFMAGSKIYVDFADKEGEEFDKAYELLIGELKHNGLGETEGDQNKTEPSTTPEPTPKPEEPIEEPEPPPIQTREYLTVGPVSMWNEEHVKEFLIDNKLEQLVPVCESMDGETLMELHNLCQTIPDKMYGIVNNPKEEHPVSLANFLKFISKLKKYLPPKEPRKVHFHYNYIYPPSPTTQTGATTGKKVGDQK